MRSFLPVLIAVVVLALLQVGSGGSPFFVYLASLVGVNVVLAVSLNIINGMTGQFSIGHAGFMAVGAYLSGVVSLALGEYRVGFLGDAVSEQLFLMIALLVGGGFAALCGFLVGLPSLRLKGDYLAIVTLGFGEIIRVIVQNTPSLGGALGLSGIPQTSTIFMVWFWVFVVVLLARRLASSSHGRSLWAIREDEVAAEAMGVDTTSYKVRAFVVSSFFAGIAGGLFAHFVPIINPNTFTFVKSIEVVVMIVAGGLGSTTGAVTAAVFLTLLPEGLRTAFQKGNGEIAIWAAVAGFAAFAVASRVRALSASWSEKTRRNALILGVVAVCARLGWWLWRVISPVQESAVDGDALAQRIDQVRMPIYGLLLVLIMLTRSQGIFGTHEIWDLIKRRRPAPKEAAAGSAP